MRKLWLEKFQGVPAATIICRIQLVSKARDKGQHPNGQVQHNHLKGAQGEMTLSDMNKTTLVKGVSLGSFDPNA